MVGQTLLLKQFEDSVQKDNFPHFIIITGVRGSGKKTLIQELTKNLISNTITVPDISVASVRTVIQEAYKNRNYCYIIPDADDMSVQAKNALLKVTEEPPNDSYFIMTLRDPSSTLETIKSRATMFQMQPYTRQELQEYIDTKYNSELSTEEIRILLDVCQVPGEINTLIASNVMDFYKYVQLVDDNITEVSISNAFKIPSKVTIKDNDTGYDLQLFWKAFMCVNINKRDKDGAFRVQVTSKYLRNLSMKGVNKQMLIDNWILDIRED